MNSKALGVRIRMTRKDNGMTSETLADACNINATYLRQIEAGDKVPSLPIFTTLCKELGSSPNYLLADDLSGGPGCDDVFDQALAKATPSQLKIIKAMLRAALEEME